MQGHDSKCVCVCVCVSARFSWPIWVGAGSRPSEQLLLIGFLVPPTGADPGLAVFAVTSSENGRWSWCDDVEMTWCHSGRADTLTPAHVLAITYGVCSHRGNKKTSHLRRLSRLWIHSLKYWLFLLVDSVLCRFYNNTEVVVVQVSKHTLGKNKIIWRTGIKTRFWFKSQTTECQTVCKLMRKSPHFWLDLLPH